MYGPISRTALMNYCATVASALVILLLELNALLLLFLYCIR